MTSNFIIVAEPRAGGRLLKELVNGFAGIICEDQLFHQRRILTNSLLKSEKTPCSPNQKKQNSFLPSSFKKALPLKMLLSKKQRLTLEDFNDCKLEIAIDRDELLTRDADPDAFISSFFAKHHSSKKAAGFLLILGSNYSPIEYALNNDVKIIYLRRANKLAQFESVLKSLTTGFQATDNPDLQNLLLYKRCKFNRAQYLNISNELQMNDDLFRRVLRQNVSKDRHLVLDYSDLFDTSTITRVSNFLNTSLSSETSITGKNIKTLKLGKNLIIERFSNKKFVRNYFSKIEPEWLNNEI